MDLNDDGAQKKVWVSNIYKTASAALDDIAHLQLAGVRGLNLEKLLSVA